MFRTGAFLISISNLLFTGALQLFEMVFKAKSPCSMGNVEDDEIKCDVLSMVIRFGDHADGSSAAVQCGEDIKSKCNSWAGLFTLEVIQLTRFLLGFDVVGAPMVE